MKEGGIKRARGNFSSKKNQGISGKSEVISSSFTDNLPYPCVIFSIDQSIKYTNPAFCQVTGFSSDEILGQQPPFPFWPPDKQKQYSPDQFSNLESRAEWLLQKKSGELFWAEITTKIIQEKNGPGYYFSIWSDISARKQVEEKLRISEEKYTQLFNAIPIPLSISNLPDMKFLEVNDSFLEHGGYTREEIIGLRATELKWSDGIRRDPDTPPPLPSRIDNAEMELLSKSGEPRTSLLTAETVKFGNKEYLLSASIDITERKKAEAELKQINRILLAIRNIHRLITQVKDPQKLLEEVCQTLKQIRGYETCWAMQLDENLKIIRVAESGIGSDFEMEKNSMFRGIFSNCVKQAITSNRAVAIQEDSPICTGCPAPRKIRSNFYVVIVPMNCHGQARGTLSVSASQRIPLNDQEIALLQELADDIGLALYNLQLEIKKAETERQLEEIEAFNSRILENSPYPMMVINVDTSIRYVNPALLQTTGYSKDELIGHKSPYPWWPAEKRTEYLAIGKEKQEVAEQEQHFQKKNGEAFWVVIMRRKITENGQTKYLLSSWVDVTERKEMEDRILELYGQEKKQREELQEEAKARGMFIDVLAHELRTPLTPIVASIGMLNDMVEAQPENIQKRLLANVNIGAQSLVTRLEELLDLARYSRGAFKLALQTTDFKKYLEAIVLRFQPTLNEKRQKLITDMPEKMQEVAIDRSRLEQVIINLLSNAVKFSPDEGNIALSVQTTGHELSLEVKDNGIGISAEEQKRLFQPYHRVEQDRQKFPGIGLGLTVCKQIVEAHHGKIWVISQPGSGSTFGFVIPLKPT